MKTGRRALLIFALLILALVTGWGFRAYLAPEAVVDYVNQRFFCD
jgi:hypothetical protein